jgi:hypothetical protein
VLTARDFAHLTPYAFAALCGVSRDELSGKLTADGGQGVKDWATCLAVLASGITKLCSLPPLDADGKLIPALYRWVHVENQVPLPSQFAARSEANPYPGQCSSSTRAPHAHASIHVFIITRARLRA